MYTQVASVLRLNILIYKRALVRVTTSKYGGYHAKKVFGEVIGESCVHLHAAVCKAAVTSLQEETMPQLSCLKLERNYLQAPKGPFYTLAKRNKDPTNT